MTTPNGLRKAVLEAVSQGDGRTLSALDLLLQRAHARSDLAGLRTIQHAFRIGYMAAKLGKASNRPATDAEYCLAEKALERPQRDRSSFEQAAYKSANVAFGRTLDRLNIPPLKVGSNGALGLKRSSGGSKDATRILAITSASRRLNEALSFVERKLDQCEWLLAELVQVEGGVNQQRSAKVLAAIAKAQALVR